MHRTDPEIIKRKCDTIRDNTVRKEDLSAIETLLSPFVQRRPTINKSTLQAMQQTLKHFSESSWQANVWEIHIPTSGKDAKIRFPQISGLDADILRATALSFLVQCASAEAAQRVVREGVYFLEYLSKVGIHIESIRTSIVSLYVDHLKALDIGIGQKNSRIRSACSLYETCIENADFEAYVRAVDFSYRFSEPRGKKRAPDKCVVDALDRAFFNLAYEGIPLVIRLAYFLLRLIPNRISEVLSIDLDCISYPDLALFSVSIPTSKETPLHIPQYSKYIFAMNGKIESIFFHLIRQQQSMVRSYTISDDVDVDYLLFDATKGRALSANDVNTFLEQFIHEHHIFDANGNSPSVTSHDFRHVCIGERLRSGVYSPEQTMKEANHSNVDITLSYGYQSEHDEAENLGAISSAVLENDFKVTDQKDAVQHQRVNPAKYDRLQNSTAYIRIIPGSGLCSNAKCTPQYEKCAFCDCFTPDKLYLEYFTEAREIVQKRVLKFMNSNASPDAIAFERKQLEIINTYIEKMAVKSAHCGTGSIGFEEEELNYGTA